MPLFICGTPIGNLDDITIRALNILKSSDYIACEDTRHSLKLLNHFDIKKPLISYHEHNKQKSGEKILQLLKNGKTVSLITDAGMPAISDPGASLVILCYEHNIPVTTVPGPTAFVSALILSGLPSTSFCFFGFLPYDKSNAKKLLARVKDYSETLIFYEAPHHLIKTLTLLLEQLGDRNVGISKELTKRFEETNRLTICEAINYYEKNAPLGEYVIVVEGNTCNENDDYLLMPLQDHVQAYLDSGLNKMEAIKAAAKDRGLKKSDVYNALEKNK